MGTGEEYSEYMRREREKQDERDRQNRAYAEESARRAEEARQQSRREDMDRAARSDARSGHSNHVYGGDEYYHNKRKSAEFWDWDSYPNRTARERAAKARKQASSSSSTSTSRGGTHRASSSPSYTPRSSARPMAPPRPATRAERITAKLFAVVFVGGLFAAAGWVAIQLYQESQRAKAEAALDERIIRLARTALTEKVLRRVIAPFKTEPQMFTAAIQYNLKHMPVDREVSFKPDGLNWKYWGRIDGKWSKANGAAVDLCGGRLKNKFGLPPGLSITPDFACAGNLNGNQPDFPARLVVYTTELRHLLTARYCVAGPDRWRNCPTARHRHSRRRHYHRR